MSNILDNNTLKSLQEQGVKKVKLFFYEAGCSGMKVDMMMDDFDYADLTPTLSLEEREQVGFQIYVEKKDEEKFRWARITRVVKSDHTGKEKVRYIYSNDEVKERCGCGSSFSFEKKVPKLNLEKLKELKEKMKK